MRIGIDAHHINGKPQGSRTYLLGLIQALAPIVSDDEIVLYSFRPDETRRLLAAPNFIHKKVFPETARVRLPIVVPVLELLDRLGVFHSQYICPPLSGVPEVVTIHDILFETHPELFVGAFSQVSVWLIRRSARRARCVLTVSDFSRQAILERYGLPEDRVVVTPNAVDPARYKCLAPGEGLDKVKEKYRLQSPFVLSVGRLEPRKNLERLIRAFDRVRRRMDPGLELVIVGKEDFRHEAIHREAERLPTGAVRFLGPVPDDDLPALYNLASLLAYPSLVEGFGMPVLEAMACGTPVIASPRGALPEVGGEAVLWVDPQDEEEIAGGIEKLISDTDTRARLRDAGLRRANAFRWEETARRTLAVYHRFRSD